MNITFLSLISTSTFSNSPLFVGNQVTFINVIFQKTSSTIFFNQHRLFLKNSIFKRVYGHILYNTNENNRQTITNDFSETNKFNITELLESRSITIYNCKFDQITDDNPMLIKNKDISLYITDSLFNQCKSTNGVIFLENCRCLTMTHTCSFHSSCSYGACFLNSRCLENDFSIILYNSIYESIF